MTAASPTTRPALALYAKAVVLAVLVLIFLGGLVTSWGAGMAAPDWPLSYGSINPTGWWSNFPLRLEHGHRLTASLVGVLTLGLMGWVWRNRWIIGTAVLIGFSLVYSFVVGTQHEARSAEHMQQASWWIGLGILVVVGLITLVLTKTSPPADPGERTVRRLAWAAFVGVCLQATLGGLRVTEQTGGLFQAAFLLRIFHACVAQAFLCCLVALAALLSPSWSTPYPTLAAVRTRRLAWFTFGSIYFQLIFGAVMRHLGAGLAIPTFPVASPDGGFMPQTHNVYVDTNFTHTRVGAFIVTLHIILLAVRVFRTAGGERRLLWPAVTLLALVAVQVTLGVFVILHTKPPTLTTFHVLNGAVLLATSLLLALRLYRFGPVVHSLFFPGSFTSFSSYRVSQSTSELVLPLDSDDENVRSEAAPGLVSDLMILTKARLSLLSLVTTFVGFCLASGGSLQWGRLLNTLLGTAFAAAAAAVLNQVVESKVDRLMERTRYRPIPAGRISRRAALFLGLALTVAGPGYLWLTVNAITAALAAATIAIYVLIYTPMKRRTPFCTLVGAVAGGIPPVIGWAALRPAHEAGAWVLFGVLFAWQMPHFLAIAWMYRDEYRQAGFVMLRRDDQTGCATAFDALLCTLGLTMVTVAPFLVGITAGVYLSGALALDCAFLFLGIQFLLERDRASARRLFFGSIIYLPLVLAVMVLTRV